MGLQTPFNGDGAQEAGIASAAMPEKLRSSRFEITCPTLVLCGAENR